MRTKGDAYKGGGDVMGKAYVGCVCSKGCIQRGCVPMESIQRGVYTKENRYKGVCTPRGKHTKEVFAVRKGIQRMCAH